VSATRNSPIHSDWWNLPLIDSQDFAQKAPLTLDARLTSPSLSATYNPASCLACILFRSKGFTSIADVKKQVNSEADRPNITKEITKDF
jgi:hypothetical protein